ncbi:MAG: OmpH family outer membrane protein [Phycisphaerales bacterium]|nr:OmpH family outer membrane protein [Phycisphaerales bacterium]
MPPTASRHHASLPVLAVLAALIGLFAYQAGAVRALAARPTAVGTVDLGKVFEKMNERAEWDASTKGMEESLTAELRKRQESAQAKKAQYDALPAGAERDALRESLAKDLLEDEVWFKFKRSQVDRERSLMWQSMYRNIRAEAALLAEAEGFDLLLVNDASNEIRSDTDPNASAEAQILQQITARRVLYSQPTIDLTDKLIIRINNARAAR